MLNVLRYNPLNITLFLLLNSLNIFLENRSIIKIFKVQQKNELKLFIFQLLFKMILFMALPIYIYIVIDILIQLYLYNKILKLKSEKLYLATIINIIIKTISEIALLYKNIYLTLSIFEVILNCILFLIVKYKKIEMNINDCLIENVRRRINLMSLISIIFILTAKIRINSNIQTEPIYLYLLFNLMQIAYLVVFMRNILNTLKNTNDQIIIENLEGSNKRLQENYDSVRSFKHDFNNIMQGIGGYIIAKDIDGLNKMYKSIINECQEINENQSINSDVITNPAILNLINNKIKLAEQKNVKISVKVYINLETLKVSTYDLCRILGILIDNAIEATIGCDEKLVTIKFLKDKYNNRNLIIIENPYKNYLIDVKKIYEKGFSSKKDKISHGLGLWKVNQILKKNKNIQIYTSRDKLFKQQLEIY